MTGGNKMKHSTWKSIGAVVAGLVTIIVLSNGTDTVLETTGIFPSLQAQLEQGFTVPWMVVLALVYRCVYTILGGYVTARLAPKRPTRHVLTLGVIGLVLGIAGAFATSDIVPAWFSLALIVLGIPCAWLGGKLQQRKVHPNLTTRLTDIKGEAQ
jgi:MFS family permease